MTSFGVISAAGLGLFVLLALYIFYVNSQRQRGISTKYSVTLVGTLGLIGVALLLVGSGLIFVQPQERGMVLSVLSPTGYRPEALSPGAHFVTPGFETVVRVPIGQQAYTMAKAASEGQVKGDDSVSARTSDGQEVFIDATVQYQVDDTKVPELFIKWQDRYADNFVRPQSRSIIYNAVSQYKVEEVYSIRRAEIQKRVEDELRTVFERNGLRLTAFLLRNVTFSPEYAKSIEEKQIAQQNAERAKFLVQSEEQEAARIRVQAQGAGDAVVTRAKADGEAQIIRAKAEAESLRQVSDALKSNPDLLTFRYIEKLAPTIQTILLPSNQSLILDAKTLVSSKPIVTAAPVVPTPAPPSLAPTTVITK